VNRPFPSALSSFEAPEATVATIATVKDELQRILNLPWRDVVDCEREPGTRRWAPATQALVEVVTEQYTRGPRLSCACRDRVVESLGGGRIVVFRSGLPGRMPPLPLETTVDAFCADCLHDTEAVAAVQQMRRGQRVELKGLGAPFCLVEFNPFQAWTLYELPMTRGATGFVSVGGGKTIAGIMAPLAVPDRRTWALLAKPDQRIHYQKAYLRLREHFRVPSMVFDQGMGGSYSVADAPTVRYIPYSLLSNPKSTVLLESYNFDAAVADESHLLGNRQSSRTMRLLRFVAKREKETNGRFVFIDWSGSKIKRSMKDTTHLSAHALGLGSPYPLLSKNVEAFAKVIDPSHMPDTDSDTAKMLKQAFGTKTEVDKAFFVAGFVSNDDVLAGYRERILHTPGVISTKSSSVTCSISIRERKAPPIPPLVKEALTKVRSGFRPDGDELVDASEIALCARAVAGGFYHYWAFPKHPCKCVTTSAGDVLERCSECLLIDEWYARRKPFNKEMRLKTMNGEPYLDSRKLCEEAAMRAYQDPPYRGELPVWPALTWPSWVAIRDRVSYDERTKWIGSKESPADPEGWYLAKDAAAWAQEKRGVVWVQTPVLGQAIAKLAGIKYHGGGPNAEAEILAEDGSRSIVASIKAHGTGRDELQFRFHKQLLVEPLASGDMYEQFLGRLAREGQPEDTIETELYRHVYEFRDAWRKAKTLAQFIEAKTGNRQLLLAADEDFDDNDDDDAD
jgi:hypothetical protein